mgnify:CR=1 FL=1
MITALCIALCLSSAFAADAGKCSPKQYENVAVGKLAMSTPDGKGGLYDMVQKVTMDVDKKMSVAEIEVNGGYNQVVYSDAAKVSRISWCAIRFPYMANFITRS